MPSDEDLLTGSEMVARAFHKHLRGASLRVCDFEGKVQVHLGGYLLTFKRVGENELVAEHVSDAT